MDEDVEIVQDLDTATEDENDYLNDILSESQYMDDGHEKLKDDDIEEDPVTGEETKKEPEPKEEEPKDDDRERKERNKRNAERRLANKARKNQSNEEDADKGQEDKKPERLENDQLDAAELAEVKANNEQLVKMVEAARPVMDMIIQNEIRREDLELGIDFVKNWKMDRIGTAKKLLTALEKSGIDVGQILTHDDSEMRINGEVARRMQPIMQQRMQDNANNQARQQVESFLASHPDARQHFGEITSVMKKRNSTDLADAYYRLRRAYAQNNQPWFGDEVDDQLEDEMMSDPIPQVSTPNIRQQQSYAAPTSMRDLIRQNAHRFFNGE